MRNFILRVTSPDENLRFTTFFHKKTILLSFLSVLIYVTVYAQTGSPEDKIDPAFRFVMEQPAAVGRQVPKTFSPAFKTVPTKVLVASGKPAEDRYDCIIYTTDVTALRNAGILVNSVLPKFVTGWATLQQIEQLSKLPTVNYIAAPAMDQMHNDIAVASTGASLLHQGRLNNTVYKGKGVIVAIFDTGIDWKHPDFRNPDDTTQSRILRIWDQTLTPITGEVSPTGMGYGVEYTQAQINDELDGSPAGYVRESDIVGHGTHVAGTAAGNGLAIPATRKYMGMAPEADIIIIKGGNGTFSTTNIINALTYLKTLASTLGKPIVLNMSLGGQYGPHDGTRDYEIAIDNFTASASGRAVVISAGNDNGTNIHNQFSLASGASNTVSFTVPAGTTGTDVFEYRIYANDNSNIAATITDPSGGSVSAAAGHNSSDSLLGKSFKVYVTNQIEAGNGDRYVDVYIARIGSNTTSPAGTWTLAITNNAANSITLDGWLYYINSVFSTTALVGGNNDYLVGSPGNASTAITVASYVARPAWYSYAVPNGYYNNVARMDAISTFSSHGPRRDGVIKPEIAAIGQHVISAFSSTSTATTSDIIIPGLYRKNQGTSMSAPVVTGAVALLLQANPSVTVSQLRTTLFSNTSTDSITNAAGASPNTTWGYGRLDVYKAAGSMFNCSPVDRKTYQYDASNITSQDLAINLTIARVAVRFTPDISGALAGVYFHTNVLKTALVMELRADSAGVPGALLGTMNLPDTTIGLYSWNYVNCSGLNVPVTSGTDYFVVMYRDPSTSTTWSLRRENTNLDNRSLLSFDGINWSDPGYDFKIRSVVYSNALMTGNLITANTSITRDIATTNMFIDSSCQLIAQVTPSGASPVNGSVSASVWIEPGVPSYAGSPFVARHYQITPSTNASSATGKVTLYFTQAEFDAFNADANSALDLPANPTDIVGKANLRIGKYAGVSSDGTGLPNSYNGSVIVIDPADSDIVWNASASRWEVSFNVTGFSGFIVQTSTTALPLLVESFSGYPKESVNILNWKVSCINSIPVFDIERSANGSDYNSIGSTTAVNGCNQDFLFKDNQPMPGKNYYRIKITDNGAVHYTKFILLQTGKGLITTLYPNVIRKGQSIQVSCAEGDGLLRVSDATGRQVYSQTLTAGVQSIALPVSVSGIYFYSIQSGKGIQSTGKIIIQ